MSSTTYVVTVIIRNLQSKKCFPFSGAGETQDEALTEALSLVSPKESPFLNRLCVALLSEESLQSTVIRQHQYQAIHQILSASVTPHAVLASLKRFPHIGIVLFYNNIPND